MVSGCLDDYISGRILNHDELSSQEERGESEADNGPCFKSDFLDGRLDEYKGSAVVYWKGILCGQGANSDDLLRCAQNYYGKSNLTVFNVPTNEQGLDKVINAGYERR